jgi:acyl-CoA reductase-like NAD-dependent aldehyde dehydrogenase
MKMFIDGKWVASESGETFAVTNPADGRQVDSVPRGAAEDVKKAVDAAEDAYGKWSAMPAIERSRVLYRVADVTRSLLDDLAVLLTTEQGKPLKEAKAEIGAFASTFEYYAGLVGRVRGSFLPLSTGDGQFVVTKRPIGIVGAILPWNFPISLMAWKIAPGLAAGNTFVAKPASTTPLTNLKIGDVLSKAGLAPGAVNIVTGPGSEVGGALLASPKVRKISFTGETETGKRIMQEAARDIKRVTLELGGSDPMIVCEDAEMELAIEGAMYGRFRNAGQNCVAVKRLLLEESIANEFIEKLVKRVKAIHVGPGLDPNSHMGPLHTSKQREEVESMVEDATGRGAKVLAGGKRPKGKALSSGYFYEPTLLGNVKEDASISREECFGPALPIFRFKGIEEAIERANDTIYGLGSSVWTKDLQKAFKMAERIEAGTTWINSPHLTRAEVPFGGFKQSGLGRELGVEGLDYYQETKSIQVYDYAGGKKWAFPA